MAEKQKGTRTTRFKWWKELIRPHSTNIEKGHFNLKKIKDAKSSSQSPWDPILSFLFSSTKIHSQDSIWIILPLSLCNTTISPSTKSTSQSNSSLQPCLSLIASFQLPETLPNLKLLLLHQIPTLFFPNIAHLYSSSKIKFSIQIPIYLTSLTSSLLSQNSNTLLLGYHLLLKQGRGKTRNHSI